MTAKEKADELFDRFYEIEPVEPIYVGVNIGQAKQCVLICVKFNVNGRNASDYCNILASYYCEM